MQPRGHLFWVWKAQEDDSNSLPKGKNWRPSVCLSNLRTLQTLQFSKHFNESSKCLTDMYTAQMVLFKLCIFILNKTAKRVLKRPLLRSVPILLSSALNAGALVTGKTNLVSFSSVSHSEMLILSGVYGKQLWSSE